MAYSSVLLLLKAPATACGVTAPLFIWLAAGFIFTGTLACLLRLWWVVRRERGLYQRLQTQLGALQTTDSAAPRDGMTSALYHAMAQVFTQRAAAAPTLVSAWRRFAAQMVVKRDASGEERFWTSESAAVAFNDAAIIEPRLNRSFFSALPGMATGAGLLCTFLAILLSLLEVRLENEQFRGLDMLISGLSGKFLSSIAALLIATLYIFFEKRLLHRLSQGVHALGVALDELVPRLTPAGLLVSLHERLEAQSTVWQNMGHDLGSALQKGVEAGMGSTLAPMLRTMEELNQWLQTAETQRAQDTTGRLEGLLQQLGNSLTASFSQVSDRFAHSLSQSASQEFESVASALRGSAQLLADMNTQFFSMQGALNSLVELAKNTTVEQMAAGKNQTEELAVLLREMTTQMHDTTGLSVQHMAATLTSVVHDLSSRVSEMSQGMSQMVSRNADKTAQATQVIMGRVDQWTSQSTQQLAQLIDKHQTHLERVQDVQHTMESTLSQFKDALSAYATVTSGLQSVATQTTAMVTASTGAVNTLKDTSAAIAQVARMATAQADRLAETNRQQEDGQQRLMVNLQHYQQIFRQVETSGGQFIEQIDQHLRHYMASTQQGFEHVTQAADVHFANASQRLGDTVHGLDEHLQDLTDILERFGRVGGVNGHA